MPTMMGYARNTVNVPAPPIRSGGVLSVANVIDVGEGDHALLGAEYLTDACAEAKLWFDFCSTAGIAGQCTDPALDPALLKEFAEGQDQVVGDPFAVYAGVSCGDQRIEAARARAKARLTYAEPAQIDAYVWLWMVQNAAVTPVGPASAVEAIGWLEELHAALYGGPTTFLVPRRFIGCLAQAGVVTANLDGSLTTISGSLVAPVTRPLVSAVDPETVKDQIFGTGQITIIRGPVRTDSVGPMVRADGSCEPSRALAERIVVPMTECAPVVAEVTCCCGVTP
jgi:hypothetical protein